MLVFVFFQAQDTITSPTNVTFLEHQTISGSNEDNHNYLASENETNADVIYVVDPQITSNMNFESIESSNICNNKPSTIFVCNPNFSNVTVMDAGANC